MTQTTDSPERPSDPSAAKSFAELLAPEQLRQLRKLSPVHSWLALAGIWGTMAGTVWLVSLWTHPLAFVLAAVVIGSRQFALAVMMHEASHGLVFASRRLNDRICQWLCAYPIMQDIVPYRPYHAAHHKHTETDQDPDLALSRVWPASRASLARKILRDLTGIAGVRRYWGTLRSVSGSSEWSVWRRAGHFWGKTRGFWLTNALLLTLFAVFTHWSWYLLLWWVPMLTWYSLIYRIRNVAEHAMVPAENEFSVARTTLPSRLHRWAIAPLNVGYHAEHHLMPNCPWYRLPELHALLHEAMRREGSEGRLCSAPGYLAVLRSVVAPG